MNLHCLTVANEGKVKHVFLFHRGPQIKSPSEEGPRLAGSCCVPDGKLCMCYSDEVVINLRRYVPRDQFGLPSIFCRVKLAHKLSDAEFSLDDVLHDTASLFCWND